MGIWNNYLNKNLQNAPSMIFSLLHNTLNTILGRRVLNGFDASNKAEINSIVEFFEKVKNYIESKNSYPNNLNDNPILEEEFNQIMYLINLILTPAIINIILSQLMSSIRESDTTLLLTQNQTDLLRDIRNTTFNGQTIESFVSGVLPKLAYKYYTTTYSNSNDTDMKIASSGDLFLPIVQIIKSIKIIQITDNSPIIQNIKEYLIPFLSNTYQNFIYHIRLAIYGYERYLLNTYQITKNFQLLT